MSFLDKMKNLLVAPDGEEEYEYEDEEQVEEEEAVSKYQPTSTSYYSNRDKNRVAPVVSATRSSTFKIQIQDPIKYDDAPKIIDKLIMNDAVVVNFEHLEPELKRQVFDFINGGIYAIEGKIQKVTKDIFILAPKGVGIEGIKEELMESGLYNW
ncbi:MAG: cell division protein SepF [Ezakiella sp.]|nr:cell division protein SepF [Ezakiella sp.]